MGKRAALSTIGAFLFVLVVGNLQAAQESAPSAGAVVVKDIQLSFKRDPRVVDSFRGIGPWVSGPNYAGANAQDTVEARAEGVDAAGKPAKISPEWIPSDPEMVTVSPSQGDDVKITVHKAGESKLKITYQGLLKELELRAKYVNEFMMFEIEEAKAVKPAAPVATGLPPARKTKSDVSYAAGMALAKALEKQFIEVDEELVMRGFKDAESGGKTLLTEEEAWAALAGVQTDPRVLQANLDRKALAEKNKLEGEAFLAANKPKKGVVTLPSGLQYKIIKAGQGRKPTANDVVNVQYRGTFINGKEFDNTFGRRTVARFPVRAVVKGLAEALQLMPEGSRWQVFVPSDLAYGERGSGAGGSRRGGPLPQVVGPNATLIFELELVSIQEPSPARASAATQKKSGEADK